MAISIVLDRPGRGPLDLAGAGYNAVRYSTVVSGGFASAVIVAPGDARKAVPPLSTLRILNDDRILFEGLVEDREYAADQSSQVTTITAFGKQRLLQLASVNRFWVLRSLSLTAILPASVTQSNNLLVTLGFIDPANPTSRGVRIQGRNLPVTNGVDNGGASLTLPTTGAAKALLGHCSSPGGAGGLTPGIEGYGADGIHTTAFVVPSVGFDFTLDLSNDPAAVTVGLLGQAFNTATYTPSNDLAYTNLRLLGASVTEDASGGFYAATLLRDVLSFVPGITAGQIDAGVEYLITELTRDTRSNVQSVVAEIASYYTREWGVWEEGRFDWTQPNLSEPGWTLQVADLIKLDIKETVDGLIRDTYLTYTDPTDQRQKEASYQTPRLSNPFTRLGILSDDVEAPGLSFTPASAAALAQAENQRLSQIPAVQGQLVVSPWKLLPRSTGGLAPACEIRAGDNVTVPDFPTDDSFSAGADNQSLFHVIQSDVDLSAATVTLTIAGYLPALDVLTARLNAATKIAQSSS